MKSALSQREGVGALWAEDRPVPEDPLLWVGVPDVESAACVGPSRESLGQVLRRPLEFALPH
jgi:hypothetical protein